MKPLFVIFGTHGRAGTKWLADCLQPAVHMSPQGEIWQPHQIKYAMSQGSPDPWVGCVQYLRWWCEKRGPECRGAKAFPSLLPNPWDERLVTGVDRVIFVYRRNLTEQMVSLAVASKAGWSKHRQRDPDEPFVVDVNLAIANAEQAVKAWRRCVEAVPSCYVVAYEDLGASVQAIRGYVDLPPLPPDFDSRFEVQRSPERYRRLIANYDEINERMGERYGVLFGAPGTLDQVEGL